MKMELFSAFKNELNPILMLFFNIKFLRPIMCHAGSIEILINFR